MCLFADRYVVRDDYAPRPFSNYHGGSRHAARYTSRRKPVTKKVVVRDSYSSSRPRVVVNKDYDVVRTSRTYVR